MQENEEVAKAREAIANGDYVQARRRLQAAQTEGVDRNQISYLQFQVDHAQRAHVHASHGGVWGGLILAVAGYVALSVRQPSEWTMAVWAPIALLLIPAATGYVASKSMPNSTSKARFMRGWWVAGFAMGMYTFINLMMLRSKVLSTDGSQVSIVMLTASVGYGIAAGIVAGLTGAALVRPRSQA